MASSSGVTLDPAPLPSSYFGPSVDITSPLHQAVRTQPGATWRELERVHVFQVLRYPKGPWDERQLSGHHQHPPGPEDVRQEDNRRGPATREVQPLGGRSRHRDDDWQAARALSRRSTAGTVPGRTHALPPNAASTCGGVGTSTPARDRTSAPGAEGDVESRARCADLVGSDVPGKAFLLRDPGRRSSCGTRSGAGLLGATLAAVPGSAMFYGLGVASAFTWCHLGGTDLVVGPRTPPSETGPGRDRDWPGSDLFGVLVAVKLAGDRVPLVSASVASVLA